jgi:hypothetical protein
MADLIRLTAVLARIPPEAWDAIIPHGPVIRRMGAARRFGPILSELNPQPLPPKARFLVASAAVAQELASAAVAAEAAGSDVSSVVARAVDEWCGTPRGRFPVPWPRPFPFPWPPDPEPHPEWDVEASRVVGALTLAALASRLDDGDAREALAGGAEKLMEVGLG